MGCILLASASKLKTFSRIMFPVAIVGRGTKNCTSSGLNLVNILLSSGKLVRPTDTFEHRITSYARLVTSNTICPIVECSAGEAYKPKTSHVILSPFGSRSKVELKFFHLREGRHNGTSPVPSTSTLVEDGGVVGKWIMQLSLQVSVSELANTKDLLQRQNSVVMP